MLEPKYNSYICAVIKTLIQNYQPKKQKQMMKKLLSILMIGTCAVLTAQNANAQACTPDPLYADSAGGIYPDSATFRSWSWAGHAGEAYSRQITVNAPADTTVDFPGVGVIDLTIEYFRVDSVVGQPSGFNYVCSGSQDSCVFMGNTSGCIQISGNPTTSDIGSYPLSVYVTARVTHILLGTFFAPQSVITSYIIDIDNSASVETLNANKFEVGQNIPNPANGSTTINFTTPTPSTVDFKVYNMLGMVVKNNKIDAVSGLNKINFNTNELSQGVYVYAITNGNTTITKRMVVSGK